MEKLKILDEEQILQKINRMSYQIIENNFDEQELVVAGIQGNGYELAQMVVAKLRSISDHSYELYKIEVDKDSPLDSNISLSPHLENFENKSFLIVDDVINTGRTLFYAISPFITQKIKKLQTLVLVKRSYSRFPVKPDFVGLSLATTLQEHISVTISEHEKSVVLS